MNVCSLAVLRLGFAVGICVALATPASAVLDVENRGPTLNAGAFAMRVTNIGALGNPFYAVGRSFDPSFEFPRGSGQQLLNHAALWVGASDPNGLKRVSGGPLMEWRPTLDPDDHVRVAYGGNPGTLRYVDDDGDGRIDEEFLDGRDDDGDGEIDEDLGLIGTQNLCARYTDDQPEAVQFGYTNGEAHVPLHLDVKQEVFTWAIPGYDHVAGVKFVITNQGQQPLTDVRIGLLADLDVREAGSAGGHVNDVVATTPYDQVFYDGTSRVKNVQRYDPIAGPVPYFKDCFWDERGSCPALEDGLKGSGLPAVAVVPLWHTTDPLNWPVVQGRISDSIVRPYITAPLHVSFQHFWFASDLPPGEGGLPIVDADRYRALAGQYPTVADTTDAHDYVTLISCGPFPKLNPGSSYEVDLAIVAATPDSLPAAIAHAVQVHHGGYVNVLPDEPEANWGVWNHGRSGITGHEICYEPPVGLEFLIDPHCLLKFIPDPIANVESAAHYEHGNCVWSDFDCDVCTGFDGKETLARWRDPAGAPTPPAWRTVPGDRQVTVEWDDRSEVLQDAQIYGGTNVRFIGYNIYRLDDWRGRSADVPPTGKFQQVASFARDTTLGARPLAQVTDTTVDYDRILYERKLHPIGRYKWTDPRVLNGFDYLYVVTALTQRTLQVLNGVPITELLESPILAGLDSVVTPHTESRTTGSSAWVVPNPFRAHAPWDRPPVPGDTFARHLDFMGLPRATCTIRIYTLAGDLVQVIEHDGTHGDGQARWDLISRNGQDIASGIYLFTVDSGGSHQVGRFVVMR
jgi:hypothetical protein